MSKAKLLLKNDVGLVLDITESPLGCTVYDLEGNEIGGGGITLYHTKVKVINNTNKSGGIRYQVAIVNGMIDPNDHATLFDANSTNFYDLYSSGNGSQLDGCYFTCMLVEGDTPQITDFTVSEVVNCSTEIEDGVCYVTGQTDFESSLTVTLNS